jgi:hypothetical protein
VTDEQRPGDPENGQSWAPFGPSGDEPVEFDPPETATPGPPPGAPPTPPPPTRPQPPTAPTEQQSPAAPAYPPAVPPPVSPPPQGYGPPKYGPTPTQPQQPYGYAPAAQRTNGKAVASLVLGIAGWLVAPFILSVLGIIFGALARKEIAANPSMGGKGMANWGFWLSITGLVAWVVLIVVLIAVGGMKSS